MRNYTLNTRQEPSIFKTYNIFTKEQAQALLDRNYWFSELFQTYEKSVGNFTKIVLDLDKQKLYFYKSAFFTPAELDIYINDKETLNKIKAEVKWLKDNNYFTQKR